MTLNVIIAEIPVIFKEIVQVDVIWEDKGEMIEADREETLIITTIGEEIMEDLIREEREAIQETEIEKEMIQEIEVKVLKETGEITEAIQGRITEIEEMTTETGEMIIEIEGMIETNIEIEEMIEMIEMKEVIEMNTEIEDLIEMLLK